MVEEENNRFYQVEMNLISASLGSLAQGTRVVHNRLNQVFEGEQRFPTKLANFEMVGKALYNASMMYGNWNQTVIVTVSDDVANAFDQDIYIEYFAERGIRNVRYSFKELVALTEFDEDTGTIRV